MFDNPFSEDGLLIYRYRGNDPNHRDNVGLQEAMRIRSPLIYFHGVIPGRCLPIWPVFIVNNFPERLYRPAAVDPSYTMQGAPPNSQAEYNAYQDETLLGVRRYVMASTKQCLRQSTFREQVIAAYNEHCALCALRHRDLLDAAHIIPDGDRGCLR